jgi:hypothetical protein
VGLFGHWGLGKTYLAQMIAKLLIGHDTDGTSLDLALARAGVRVNLAPPETFSRRYEVITFSAWRYRRTPELWVYLYETLASNCMAKDRWPRLLRYNVKRLGHMPLSLALIGTGAALASVSALKVAIFGVLLLLPIIGAAGLLWLFQTYFATRKGMGAILRRYTTLSRYNDKLGLQALLGNELRSLLIAWMPARKKFRFRLLHIWPEIAALVLFIIMWLVGQFFLPTLTADLRTVWCSLVSLLPGIISACGVAAGSSLGWQPFAAGAIWLLLWCAIVFLLVWPGRLPTDRLLLIVDDLDRVSAEEMVEVIESLKLLLEDPEIQQRVQVLMLIDEGALEYAISQKFQGLIKARANGRQGISVHDEVRRETIREHTDEARREIIREHIEKLFLCHLRLPVLSDAEVRTLTARYAADNAAPERAIIRRAVPGQFAATDQQLTPQLPIDAERAAKAISTTSDGSSSETVVAKSPATDASPSEGTRILEREVDLFFTQKEASELAASVAARVDQPGRLVSPRAVRAFLLKYQLARLLRQLAGQPDEGTQLIAELAEASFGVRPVARRCDEAPRHDIRIIVSQLA